MAYWTRARIARAAGHLILWPLVLYVMLRWFEYKQVYQPAQVLDAAAVDLGCPSEDVFFKSGDGTLLNGWFFPAHPAGKAAPFVVLLCHGNAGNISHRLLTCRALLDLGVGVFVFDYRGYGRSQGRPSETGTYLDAEAAYDWLRQKGFGQEQIVAFGESLGGAVAAELATRRPLAGLILVSTFSSVPAQGAELFPWLPVRWLATIRYDTLSKLPQVRVPILIMHSKVDTIIGYSHGERLFAAANQPKMLWEVFGDHNDTLLAGPEQCQEGLRRFFQSLPAPK